MRVDRAMLGECRARWIAVPARLVTIAIAQATAKMRSVAGDTSARAKNPAPTAIALAIPGRTETGLRSIAISGW